eukprot:4766648-Pyramimonas_sp.AAC.1
MVQERVRRRERRRAEVNREYKVELVDCSEYAKQELRYVVGMMSRNFGSYERLLRPAGLTDNCQKRRFQANGQVRCAEMHPSIAGEAAYNSRCELSTKVARALGPTNLVGCGRQVLPQLPSAGPTRGPLLLFCASSM